MTENKVLGEQNYLRDKHEGVRGHVKAGKLTMRPSSLQQEPL